MTRWRFGMITDEAVFISMEFNWDMYWDWYGNEALRDLSITTCSTNLDWFREFVYKWNAQHHNYQDVTIKDVAYSANDSYLDLSKWYFDKRFSDYIFIRNETNGNKDIILQTGAVFTLEPNVTVMIHFGKDITAIVNP